MGKRKKRTYNSDFKLRAVKLCIETDESDALIARDLGVQQITLTTWKQRYLKNQQPNLALKEHVIKKAKSTKF